MQRPISISAFNNLLTVRITAFELEAFFQFSGAERRVIEEHRRPELKLGLAHQQQVL